MDELDYSSMTNNELRGVYQANGGNFGGYETELCREIREVLTERFDYDADYYGVTGDPSEYAKWYLAQPVNS